MTLPYPLQWTALGAGCFGMGRSASSYMLVPLAVADPSQPTLAELWVWACAIARESRMEPPVILHAQSGPRDDWGSAQDEAIRGLPFSRPFERYLAGGLSRSLTAAVRSLEPSAGMGPATQRKAMYRLVCALVAGETDQEQLRSRLGLAPFAFDVVARNGLLALRSALTRSEA